MKIMTMEDMKIMKMKIMKNTQLGMRCGVRCCCCSRLLVLEVSAGTVSERLFHWRPAQQ